MGNNKMLHWSVKENRSVTASFRFTKKEVDTLSNLAKGLGLNKTEALSFIITHFGNFIEFHQLLANIQLIYFICEKIKAYEVENKTEIPRRVRSNFVEGVFLRNKTKFEALLNFLNIGYVELPLAKINTVATPFCEHLFNDTHFYVINDIENLSYKGETE